MKILALVRKKAEPWEYGSNMHGRPHSLVILAYVTPWHAAMRAFVFCSCVVALILLQNVSHTLGNALPAHEHCNLQVCCGS